MNRIAITRLSLKNEQNKKHLAYISMDENREFVDFQLFDEETSILNNIYVARVENIVTNIQAAFVRLSSQQMGFLPLEDLKTPLYVKKQSERKQLSVGDELLVQVVKDAVKTKDPVVSSKLTLTGKYVLLTTENVSMGISKKIKGDDHKRINGFLRQFYSVGQENNFGLLIRTNALEVEEEMLGDDVEQIIHKFLQLKEKAPHQSAFSCMYRWESPCVQKLKSLDLTKVDGIFTDEEDVYEDICTNLPYLKDKNLIHWYKDEKVGLSTLYNIRGNLDKLTEKKVWLKSGANIIIEQLETITFIDVNSGKNMNKNNQELYEINKEAAVEIARQLKLRNISGMIIIDFVNMNLSEEYEGLLGVLKTAVAKDPVVTQVLDVTKLGLVELTRKKGNKSLKEIIN